MVLMKDYPEQTGKACGLMLLMNLLIVRWVVLSGSLPFMSQLGRPDQLTT